jgi:hypothetical protein
LGSGISRERVAALDGVLYKLIEFLRVRVTGVVTCPYRTALDNVLTLAEPSQPEKEGIDYAQDSSTWPNIKIFLKRLSGKYSDVLNVSVVGSPTADYLLWEGVDFANTFANQEPDTEHLCIGMLAMEGVVSELVSANWDGLLEAAIKQLTQSNDFYRVCVTGVDFRGPATSAKLLKFHGCAIRAISNEPMYRPLLIARSSQIGAWAANASFAAIRTQMTSIASERRTLMIGMSAQDHNIRGLFSDARNLAIWPWNDAAPAHTFAENALGNGQVDILQIAYGDEYHANQGDICARACLPAYGKSLLLALVLNVLAKKSCAMIRTGSSPNLSANDFLELDKGILRIRDLAANAVGTDTVTFVRELVKHTSRTKSVLLNGVFQPASTAISYKPLSARHDIENDENLPVTGQREAICSLALLGLGEQIGDWTLSLGELLNNQTGAIKVKTNAGEARFIFVANMNADLKLFNDGGYKEDDGDVVVIHSSAIMPKQQRGPSKRMGRKGVASALHVDAAAILENATSIADLRQRFRQEIGL